MSIQPDPKLIAAVEEAMRQPTSYRDDSPLPAYGSTPPVPQPGVPAMSQQATDIGRAAMYCGLATVPPGLVAVAILVASEHADPTVIGMICAAPAALAVPIFALARLFRSAKPEPEVHQHFHGPVTHQTTNSRTSGVWAKSINQK
ncbi:hypothetical protein [Streptomyces griseoloalbus]|uniref:Uncharacterized protein n=1 Tax=Streptomyces griseoloalbus TaxID=67303 RepID=A0A7W8FCW8_9ACTN|nr:hypothetical protein [Streptomyces albaduncus]MBB5129800.1 hypothetical protein [Streptomyces albaduncus]GGW81050.1 hypothetical protein GCM10010340_69020 [Streptomyces albaduncus]